MSAAPELVVLHADNHLLVVNKPAGIPTGPDESGDPSLLDLGKDWIRATAAKPGAVFLGVVHRLDRPVSGVVVFSRTSKGAERLAAQLRARAISKRYLGIVEGEPRDNTGELRQWLIKDERRNVVQVVPESRADAREALTRWRVLTGRGGRTLLALEPSTGRSHQLRVAVSSLGCPLLGDLKYGARAALPDRSIALHAQRLELEHPTLRTLLAFEAEPPDLPWWDLARGRKR